MKLSQIAYVTDKPAKVEIKNHLDQSFNPPAFITVLSSESKQGMEAKLNLMRSFATIREDKDNLNEDETIKEEIGYQISCDALASITLDWEGIEDEEGNSIPFSNERAVEIYKTYPYIFNTVNLFSGNLGNFLAHSVISS